MGLLIGYSVYDEKAYGTITRIRLSGVGIAVMLFSKILTGVICGCVQIISAFVFSSLVLGVERCGKTSLIFLLLLMLVLYSAVFGAVIGMLSKNRSMCRSTVLMISMLCGYLGGSAADGDGARIICCSVWDSSIQKQTEAVMSQKNQIYGGNTNEKK